MTKWIFFKISRENLSGYGLINIYEDKESNIMSNLAYKAMFRDCVPLHFRYNGWTLDYICIDLFTKWVHDLISFV